MHDSSIRMFEIANLEIEDRKKDIKTAGTTVRLVNRGTKMLTIRLQYKQVHMRVGQAIFEGREEHLTDSIHVLALFLTKSCHYALKVQSEPYW